MKLLKALESRRDYSVKYLFELNDGSAVEALYMQDKNLELTFHSTACISSQVGCQLKCAFCHTASMRFLSGAPETCTVSLDGPLHSP
jgi:23S rRNA (adenine2503-C2)-methyltransferase